jgi:hypothetical protein
MSLRDESTMKSSTPRGYMRHPFRFQWPMIVSVALASTSAFAQTPPPGVAPIGEVFRCIDKGINWCYNFSVVKDYDSNNVVTYRAYFFAPANKSYAPNALECIYVAKTTNPPSTWTASAWSVFKGRVGTADQYESYNQFANDGQGAPANWKPVVCINATQVLETRDQYLTQPAAPTQQTLAHAIEGQYSGGDPMTASASFILKVGANVQANTSASMFFYRPSVPQNDPYPWGIVRVSYDYETNYHNGLVFAGGAAAGREIHSPAGLLWKRDVLGYSSGHAEYAVNYSPWFSLGLYARQSFSVSDFPWLLTIRNVKITSRRDATGMSGDPTVVKYNGKYYMLFSYGPLNRIHGATSNDGIVWTTSPPFMWAGHRPSLVFDTNVVRAYFDTDFGAGLSTTARTLPISHLNSFLTPTAWSAQQGELLPSVANTDVIKIANGYLAASGSDATTVPNNSGTPWDHLTISSTFSTNGVNFAPNIAGGGRYDTLATERDLLDANSVGRGLTVPQFFQDGSDTYLIASGAGTGGFPIESAYMWRLVPGAGSYFASDAGSPTIVGGWNSMQSQTDSWFTPRTVPSAPPQPVTESQFIIVLKQGAVIAPASAASRAFFAPAGKKIYKVSFGYTTNYDKTKVFAALTVPGNAFHWAVDRSGTTSGRVSVKIPDTDWVAFGLFSPSGFTVTAYPWLLQLFDLRIDYR